MTDQQKDIQVRVPDKIATGVYANVVNISASNNEVVLDFILHVPNQQQAVLSSRVVISRDTAQQMSDLLEALMRSIKSTPSKEKK
jgi:hypothetical protein